MAMQEARFDGPTERRPAVRVSHLTAVHQAFADHDLPPGVLRDLARIASPRRVPKFGNIQEVGWSAGGVATLVAKGTVREDFPDGRCRIWKRGALIGDWTGGNLAAPTALTALTDECKLVEITGAKMDRIGSTDVFRALAQMGMARLNVTEYVYGADRRPPVARVAGLLGYLGHQPEAIVVRGSQQVTYVKYVRDGLIAGPAQVDLADALGISRASVEKALAVLRDRGVLYKVEPGEARTNRRYRIKDPLALASIAHVGRY
ncbi:hypothetical protein QJ054_32950 [Streptomyces sp. AN-3]|uniref:Crp/Fnr family transcriptional regulator n=1 Tax=Streptomyces rochei TaxID=1928 RepID=A0ABW7E935_STRRO|nr:hypothetical protein [Streptomyces sp. AN-3]MDI3101854.1 hypothetical protein [Streptomyces sp. AN-3]